MQRIIRKQDKQCTYKRNYEAFARYHICRGKSINNTYSVCVCTLRYSACKGHRLIILSSVTFLAVPYFSTLCHKWPDLRGKNVTAHKSVLWFLLPLFSDTFLVLRRIERDIINVLYIGIHVMYPLVLLNLNENLTSSTYFRKRHISNLMKIRPMGSKLFHADGQTDQILTRLIVAFHNFSKAPKSSNFHDADDNKTNIKKPLQEMDFVLPQGTY